MHLKTLKIQNLEKILFCFSLKNVIQDNFLTKEHVTS